MSKLFTLAAGVVIGVAYSAEIKEAIKELRDQKEKQRTREIADAIRKQLTSTFEQEFNSSEDLY